MNDEPEPVGEVATDDVAVPAAEPGMAERALELLQAGGPVVVVLLAMSVAALAIVLAKLLQFRAVRLGDRRAAHEALALWQVGRGAEALALVRGARNPVAQALARAMRGQRRGLPEARVREEVIRYGGEVLEALRGWLRPLEVIASLAPLLGLFGTVLGMIEAFRQLEAAGNQVNPAVLSGGIWEALLTTAVGLAVAIPAVALLNWLERRVDRLAHEMDNVVTRIFTVDLSADEEYF
jgi:biopolymer transport protein ExbB